MSLATSADIKILIVEDNPIDVRFLKLALKSAGLTKEPAVVDDGLPALALLRREKGYDDHPIPDLVILDLNLKQVDGPEVLAQIRNTTGLRNLCVAILSSSPADVMEQRAAKADGYFTKPNEMDGFRKIGRQILDCYLGCARSRLIAKSSED